MQERSLNSVKVRYPLNKEEVLVLIQEWISQLVKEYQIRLIVLFGSYARGTYTYGSDVDILLVHADKKLSFSKALTLALNVSYEIDWQIHLYSYDDFNKGINDQNRFLQTILKTGIELYSV